MSNTVPKKDVLPLKNFMDTTLTGTKDYEDFLDNFVVVFLYDGRYIFGVLRSFDQFNNITLEKSICRVFLDNEYAEKKLGLYIIRGENVILIGLSKIYLRSLDKVDYEYLVKKIEAGSIR